MGVSVALGCWGTGWGGPGPGSLSRPRVFRPCKLGPEGEVCRRATMSMGTRKCPKRSCFLSLPQSCDRRALDLAVAEGETKLLLSLKHLTGDPSHGRSGTSGPRVHNLNLFIAASTGRPNASSCLTTSAHITASPGLIYSHSAHRFLSSALARRCTDLHSSAAGADRDLLTSGTGSSR